MADFPATLPAPLQSGYGIEPTDPVLRTQMQAGPARTRRQFTSFPSKITVKWRFSQAELAVFEAWHHLSVLDGQSWFNITLLNGMGTTVMEAKFEAPPKSAAISGVCFEVSASLEVRNIPRLTQAHLDVSLSYFPDELTYSSSALHTLTNLTLPSANYL
ncbi:MAG: hypothetical protein WC710_11460 [Gallionella sp.]|jgi:hypothetical protein